MNPILRGMFWVHLHAFFLHSVGGGYRNEALEKAPCLEGSVLGTGRVGGHV